MGGPGGVSDAPRYDPQTSDRTLRPSGGVVLPTCTLAPRSGAKSATFSSDPPTPPGLYTAAGGELSVNPRPRGSGTAGHRILVPGRSAPNLSIQSLSPKHRHASHRRIAFGYRKRPPRFGMSPMLGRGASREGERLRRYACGAPTGTQPGDQLGTNWVTNWDPTGTPVGTSSGRALAPEQPPAVPDLDLILPGFGADRALVRGGGTAPPTVRSGPRIRDGSGQWPGVPPPPILGVILGGLKPAKSGGPNPRIFPDFCPPAVQRPGGVGGLRPLP